MINIKQYIKDLKKECSHRVLGVSIETIVSNIYRKHPGVSLHMITVDVEKYIERNANNNIAYEC